MDGALLAPALAGHPSPWANGCGIPVSAGLLPATNLGVGLLTTMAAGFLMPLVADGFIRRPPFMDSEAMEVSQESVFRPSYIRLVRFIGPRRPFSFDKMESLASYR